MGQVMTVLQGISEVTEDFWAYKNRVNARRVRSATESDLTRAEEATRKAEQGREQAEQEREQEKQARMQEKQRREQAEKEREQAKQDNQAMMDKLQQLMIEGKTSPENIKALLEGQPASFQT